MKVSCFYSGVNTSPENERVKALSEACLDRSYSKFFAVILAFFLIAFSGCASVSGKEALNESKGSENSVEEFFLDNGIPVYVKANYSNRLVSVAVVNLGGSVLYEPEESGMELSLLRMMKSGSEKYSFEEIQNEKYRTHANLFGVCRNEGSYLGISCLDYYFDSLLDILADGLLHPVFNEKEFNTMLKEHAQRLQSMKSDPGSLAYYSGIEEIYKGHPYQTHPWPTEQSLKNITVENLKKLHEKFIDAQRMAIVVVGDVDAKKTVRKLNRYFGGIPAGKSDFSREEFFSGKTVPEVKLSGNNVVLSSPESAGTGFITGFFSFPSAASPDFAAAMIASDMYSDMLYQVVREKYGACYTPSCSQSFSLAALGVVNFYRISNLENILSYAAEARSLMAEGKLICGKKSDGEFVFEPVDSRLESYKNSFINRNYARQKTVSGVCEKMVDSLFLFGDPYTEDFISQQIHQLTANQVEDAFEKYFENGKVRYFCVTEPGSEGKIRF